jgi:hypothetical protein
MGEGLPRHFLPPRSDGGVQKGSEATTAQLSPLDRFWITPLGRAYLNLADQDVIWEEDLELVADLWVNRAI